MSATATQPPPVPLSAHDYLPIYGSTFGLVQVVHGLVDTTQLSVAGWTKNTHGVRDGWALQGDPAHLLWRWHRRHRWVVAQRFRVQPSMSSLSAAVASAFISVIGVESEAVVPLRIRIPVRHVQGEGSPDAPHRCQQVPDSWRMVRLASGLPYGVALVSTQLEGQDEKLWVQALLGGDYVTDGKLRQLLHLPDLRRVAGLGHGNVPTLVGDAVDQLLAMATYYERHHGVVPDHLRESQEQEIGRIRVDDTGCGIDFDMDLPGISARQLFAA